MPKWTKWIQLQVALYPKPSQTQIQCRLGANVPCILTPNLWPLKRGWWAQRLAILWWSLRWNKHDSNKSANGAGTLSLSLSLSFMLMENIYIYDSFFSQDVWAAQVIIDHLYLYWLWPYQVSFAIMQVRYPKNIQPTRCTYINPLQLRPRPHHLQVCFSRCQARQSDPASDHGQSLLCSGRLRKSVRC